MKNITIIAAIGANNELGKDNDLIWRLPEDLKFFKEKTTGHPIVMGMNTLNSLPRKLKNRKYIVITSQNRKLDPDIKIVHSIDELLEYINTLDEETFIIGGASIYNQMIDYTDKMYLTEVEETCDEADVYFPTFNKDEWNQEILSEHVTDENIKYTHKVYTRKLSKR